MSMIDKYLKIPVVYREYECDVPEHDSGVLSDIYGLDDTYNEDIHNIGKYKEPVTILCAIDRDVRVTFTGDTVSKISNQLYLTKEKITPKSILNGHIVTVVTPVYDFCGKVSHYESSMG